MNTLELKTEIERQVQIMMAYVEGAKLERRRRNRNNSAWDTCAPTRFNWTLYDYRVPPPNLEDCVNALEARIEALESQLKPNAKEAPKTLKERIHLKERTTNLEEEDDWEEDEDL